MNENFEYNCFIYINILFIKIIIERNLLKIMVNPINKVKITDGIKCKTHFTHTITQK